MGAGKVMTDCLTLKSQAASAHHCYGKEAQAQKAAVTAESHEAGDTASSCSFTSTASPLLPVLLPLSYPHPQHKPPSPGPSLVFHPRTSRKSPKSQHQWQDSGTASLQPGLPEIFFFILFPFSCPLAYSLLKKSIPKLNAATTHQLSAIPLSILLNFSCMWYLPIPIGPQTTQSRHVILSFRVLIRL